MPRRIERFPRKANAQVLTLIDQIYTAATGSTQWLPLLESLAKTTGSEIANLTFFDPTVERGVVGWQWGGDSSLVLEYEKHWAVENPYMRAGVPFLRTGVVIQGEAVVPDSAVKRTAFYNDFLTRLGVWYHTTTCLSWEDSFRANLLVNRKIGKPSHTPNDIALLRILLPHLQRAVSVYRRLEEVELERSATEAALDRLPVGVLILGTGGSARSYNAAAKAVLEQSDGISLGSAGLKATHVTQADDLRRLIASACASTSVEPAGGWLQIPRPSGRRPFVVLVAPLRLPDRTLGLNPPKAIAFITDPERAPESLENVLVRLYGLTPAESNVTAQLLAGASVAELAERLEITEYTARTHLKRIFNKVGVRTQAELIRLLLNGVAGLRPDNSYSAGRG